jgi:hypothetical protein
MKAKTFTLGGLLCIVLALTAAGVTEWSAGKQAIEASRTALALGKVHEATALARRAAEAAVPGSPYALEGFVELEIIARASEAQGRFDEAAFAWRAMRSAAEATRPARASNGRIEEAEAGMLRTASLASVSSPVVLGAPQSPLRMTLGAPPSLWMGAALGWVALALAIAAFSRSHGPFRRKSPV